MEELQHPVGRSMGYPPPVLWGAVREGSRVRGGKEHCREERLQEVVFWLGLGSNGGICCRQGWHVTPCHCTKASRILKRQRRGAASSCGLGKLYGAKKWSLPSSPAQEGMADASLQQPLLQHIPGSYKPT